MGYNNIEKIRKKADRYVDKRFPPNIVIAI